MTELQPPPKEPRLRPLLSGQRKPLTDLEAKFKEVMAKHPELYRLFCRFTAQLINAGAPHGSATVVLERIRWETLMAPTDEGVPGIVVPLKVTNNHRAYLSRLWMEDHPAHPEFFRTRKTRGRNVRPSYNKDGQALLFTGDDL